MTNQADVESLKQRVQAEVDRLTPELLDTSRFLHANPELAHEEHKAAERLTAVLERHGFAVARGVAGLPTAFLARAEAAISAAGERGMLRAAKAMAMTAVDLLAQPAALARASAEFRGDPVS